MRAEKDKSYHDNLQAKLLDDEMRAEQNQSNLNVSPSNPVNNVKAADLSDIFSAPEQSSTFE